MVDKKPELFLENFWLNILPAQQVGTGVLAGMLGPRMKYSSCLYPKGSETLGQAEVEMLRTYSKLKTQKSPFPYK
jgi:cyclopropane fatty-acyl-phospholipid synthase-like methyltransferase